MGVTYDKIINKILMHKHKDEDLSDFTVLDARYLKLNQGTVQTVNNGIPLLNADYSDFNNLNQFVNKRYVDLVVSSLIVDWYALDTDSGISDYKLTTTSIDDLGETEYTLSFTNLADGEYIKGWMSQSGQTPSILPAGVYNLWIYARKSSGTKNLQLYWELVERKSDSTEVVLQTSSYSDFLTSTKQQYIVPLLLQNDVIPASGSRIIGKIYVHVTSGGSSPSLEIYYEDDSMTRWSMPTTTEILANQYVPYSGATQNVNLGDKSLSVENKDIIRYAFFAGVR